MGKIKKKKHKQLKLSKELISKSCQRNNYCTQIKIRIFINFLSVCNYVEHHKKKKNIYPSHSLSTLKYSYLIRV